MIKIGIHTEVADKSPQAKILAKRLSLPLTATTDDYDYLLVLTSEHIELRQTKTKSLPLFIDFQSGKIAYRSQHTSLRREILARAMGLKNHTNPTIVDATTGLGRDSFILASLGFHVTMLERSPLVTVLLEDGLQRAAQDEKIVPTIQRMHLIETDATTWLQQNPKPDIIYLDPMFPERTKSALVKKEMRIFHDVLGEDLDAGTLLNTALARAAQRVVVKRPRLAEALGGVTPHHSLTGSSSRFDVYITQGNVINL